MVDGWLYDIIAMYISLDSEKSNVNVNGYYDSTKTVASCMKKLYPGDCDTAQSDFETLLSSMK
jgi:hypothetical protein